MFMEIISTVSAIGLGSILAIIVQYLFSNYSAIRYRKYEERKEAYVGLLEAWVRQENTDFTQASEKDVGLWVERVLLVASDKVHALLSGWLEVEPGSKERIDVTKQLKAAMRGDLKSL